MDIKSTIAVITTDIEALQKSQVDEVIQVSGEILKQLVKPGIFKDQKPKELVNMLTQMKKIEMDFKPPVQKIEFSGLVAHIQALDKEAREREQNIIDITPAPKLADGKDLPKPKVDRTENFYA